MTMIRAIVVVACAVGTLGCTHNDTDLGNEEHVREWANSASPIGAYSWAHKVVALAYGRDTFADASCPERDDDGTTLTLTGNCVTSAGSRYDGRATAVRTADGLMVTFDGFGSGSTVTGTFTAHDLSATSHTFVANYVVRESDVTTSIDYEGSVEGSFTTAETVWSGSGTITRDGASPTGTVEATTVDQRRDDTICNNQSLSGTTTLTANDHTATLTYDGATDCDANADAEWSLDGVPQGSIANIGCSIGRGGTSAPAFLLLAVGFVFAFRRR